MEEKNSTLYAKFYLNIYLKAKPLPGENNSLLSQLLM